MASQSSLVLLALASCLLLISTPDHQVQAQKGAPAPEAPGPINLTAILEKGGQFTTLIRLLTATQIGSQITNQLNSSDQGMTLFAPTDNAFNSLKPGTLNGLTTQEQVELVLYHVLPKYYSLVMFQTVSNPVRTQATGQDGGAFGLNFTSAANQVNVSTGMVEVQLNNALRQEFPLAVYEVEKVLLPLDLFGAKPPASPPPPPSSATKKSPPSSAGGPSSSSSAKDDTSSAGRNMGMGFVGVVLMFMGALY
ncbi:FAS1 domain [Macleaya cordata]|uniref:FAS1 domain n=1 Tax=Macleaya cordata TaxID=56857 RepID=A0A200QL04_MACCD|nr:FAS1 domain [Macleaya cordata]